MKDLTHGCWSYQPADPGHSGSFYEPQIPGHPACVYSDVDVYSDYRNQTEAVEVPIATMNEPSYPDLQGGYVQVGDMDANARFLSLAPRMYEKLLATHQALHDCGYDEHDDPPGSPWHGLYSKIGELLADIRGHD